MPFNSKGEWETEDDSVASRVASLTAQDSPLMKQATGLGVRTANRRGLINSSISAGAARASQLSAAVPIASQDASQIASKNLARIQGDYGLTANRLTLESNEREGAAGRISQAFSDYNQTMGNLAGNTKIKAKDRAAMQASTRDVLTTQLAMFKNLYPGANLDWGSNAPAAT
jgi:hypothetical protein